MDVSGQIVTDPSAASVLGPDGKQYQASYNNYYTFQGVAGELMNFEVLSSYLTNNPKPLDTMVQVYQLNTSTGQLSALPYYSSPSAFDDDNFESSDSSLVDVKLPSTGTYVVEVSPFSAAQAMQYDNAECGVGSGLSFSTRRRRTSTQPTTTERRRATTSCSCTASRRITR